MAIAPQGNGAAGVEEGTRGVVAGREGRLMCTIPPSRHQGARFAHDVYRTMEKDMQYRLFDMPVRMLL